MAWGHFHLTWPHMSRPDTVCNHHSESPGHFMLGFVFSQCIPMGQWSMNLGVAGPVPSSLSASPHEHSLQLASLSPPPPLPASPGRHCYPLPLGTRRGHWGHWASAPPAAAWTLSTCAGPHWHCEDHSARRSAVLEGEDTMTGQ